MLNGNKVPQKKPTTDAARTKKTSPEQAIQSTLGGILFVFQIYFALLAKSRAQN